MARDKSTALSAPPRRLLSTFARLSGRAVDRGLLRLMRHPSRMPKPSDYARVHEEIAHAHALYVEQGAHARDFLAAPLPIELMYTRTGFHPRVRYESVWFESGFEIDARDRVAERWSRYPKNQLGHAFVVRQRDPTRPWLVCLHGLGTGGPVRDFSAFRAHTLHALGYNLLFPVLPMHGPRRDLGRPLGALVSFELVESFHGIRQAVHDVRRLVHWLRRQGASSIGLYGMSMGAYVAGLVAGLEPFDFLMAGIPLCDMPDLFVHHASMGERQHAEDLAVLGKPLRELFDLVSPLTIAPLVPKERRFIYAANEDQVTTAQQAERLWEHWEQPRMRWFSGGHVSFYWSSAVDRFVVQSLLDSGFGPARS